MLIYERCNLCKRKVTMNTSGGYMELQDGLYHYKCVCKYGYQKLLYEKDKHIEDEIQNKKNKEEYKQKKKKELKYRDEIDKIKEKYKVSNIPDDIINFIINPDKNDFKKLSLIYHPDKGGNENYFKIIIEYKKEDNI